MKHFRVCLNLIHYFQDYRQLSKIYLNDNIKIIRDLEDYIAEVFNIEKSFYLMCKSFYLPSTESIHLLDDNELVYVLPDLQSTSLSEKNHVSSGTKKKTKKSTKKVFEEIEDNISGKQKKKKLQNDVGHEASQSKSEKEFNKSLQIVKHNSEIELNKSRKLLENYEKLNHNSADKCKKRKFNSKNIYEEMDVCSSSRKNNSNIDSLNNTNLNCNTTYGNESNIFQENSSNTSKETDIHSTNENMLDGNIEDKSRKRRRLFDPTTKDRTYSEMFRDENTENTNKNESNQKILNNTPKAIMVQSVETLDEEKQNKYNKEITKNSENSKSYGLDDIIDFGNSRSPIKTEQNDKNSLKHSFAVANIVKFLEENSLGESNKSNIQSNNKFGTKRRVRVRSRKKKHPETNESANETSNVFKPPKTIAAPKSHIKFTDDEENQAQDGFEDNLAHSTPKLAAETDDNDTGMTKMAEPTKNINSIHLSLDNLDLSQCSDLVGLPSTNSLLLFKKLKMDDSYAPVISEPILAEIKEVTSNGEQLKLKILDGINEFKEPMGRFSCIFEEDENNSEVSDNTTTVVVRSSLIEPKILKL